MYKSWMLVYFKLTRMFDNQHPAWIQQVVVKDELRQVWYARHVKRWIGEDEIKCCCTSLDELQDIFF